MIYARPRKLAIFVDKLCLGGFIWNSYIFTLAFLKANTLEGKSIHRQFNKFELFKMK